MKYIVSDERKFVYFVVPKVACSSVKTALLPLFDVDPTEYEYTRNNGTAGLRVHKLFDKSAYQINMRQLVAGLDGKYRGYFKFAFVRNPWDRLVSCYFEKIAGNGPGLKLPADVDVELRTGVPFAEFAEAVSAIPDDKANVHFRSQHEVIRDPGRDKQIMADFVGHFENLSADFDAVAERIGGAQKLRLPHVLRSENRQSRPYAEFYDDRLRDLVHERYQKDIETFGYSF